MFRFIKRLFCFHKWEHEQDINGCNIWVCRKCNRDTYEK